MLGVVAVVVFFLAPQPTPERLPALDDGAGARAASAAAADLGLAPVLVLGGAPREVVGADATVDVRFLGEDWQLDYARTEPVVDVATWRQGVLSPGDRRVTVEQAPSDAVDDTWLARPGEEADREPAEVVAAAEPLEVAGVQWQRLRHGDGRTAYVREDGGTTTSVSATDDAAYLVEVVELLSAPASAPASAEPTG